MGDSNGDDLPITLALENLALALGPAAAVPLPELIRALERAAERLRTGTASDAQPHDLISQSEAARVVGVSRQAVHQWVQKGTVGAHRGPSTTGRQASMVSLSEVVAAANRASEPPFSLALRRQFMDLPTRIAPLLDPELTETLPRAFEAGFTAGRRDEAGRVLREFVIAAMGTSTKRQEFTEVGVQMLADMTPLLAVDEASPFGRLARPRLAGPSPRRPRPPGATPGRGGCSTSRSRSRSSPPLRWPAIRPRSATWA